MKTINMKTKASSVLVGVFSITLCLLTPMQLSYAQNKVVVIPLAGDDTLPDPTAPVAKVDPSQADYTLTANTTIDNTTGLEWQREDDNTTRSWNDALNYCAGLNLDGKTDWRLPDILELQSIVDYGQVTDPIIDSVAFPNTDSLGYWSASSRANISIFAWGVFFSNGGFNNQSKALFLHVRCVR